MVVFYSLYGLDCRLLPLLLSHTAFEVTGKTMFESVILLLCSSSERFEESRILIIDDGVVSKKKSLDCWSRLGLSWRRLPVV